MARLFDEGSNEYLEVEGTPPVSGFPMAVCALVRTASDGEGVIFSIEDKDSDQNSYFLKIDSDGGVTRNINCGSTNGGAQVHARTSVGMSLNTWHLATGIWASATDRRSFIDGGSEGNDVTNVSVSGFDQMSVGRWGRSSVAWYLTGEIAELAIWDLSQWPGATNADKADNFEKILLSLANRVSPANYRTGLVAHWDLIRGLNDNVGGYNLTASGTSVSNHPRIIVPSHTIVTIPALDTNTLKADADIIVTTAAAVKEDATLDASPTIVTVTDAVLSSEQTLGVDASIITGTEADVHEEAEIAASAAIEIATELNAIVGVILSLSASAAIEVITAVDMPDTTILTLGASAAIELTTSIINVDVTYTFNHGNILGDIITFIRPGQNTNCDQGSAVVFPWSAPIPTEMAELSIGVQEQVEASPMDENDFTGTGQIKGHEYFWYEMAHLLPRIIQELGNLVSEQVINCDCYNADRENKITVQSITNDLGYGIDVAGVPTAPFDIESQDSLIFTLTVKSVGDVTIDASYTLHLSTGEDYTIYITGSRIVMFPIRPETPLREHLLFDTKIIEAVDGSEQRIANRQYPRSMFEGTYKNGQQMIEMILFDRQSKIVAVPAWHEPSFLNAAHSAGVHTVSVNTTNYANFYVGGYAIVVEDEYTYDALKIQSMTATSLTFESELSFDYTKKATVMPLLTAYIEASSASLKYPYNEQYFNLRIHVDPEVNDIASAAAFPTYNSEPFMSGPNKIEGGQLAEAIRTKIFVVDNLSGLRTQHTAWDHSKRYSKKGWKTNTRQEVWELRQLLHYLKGRQVGFYIPTFWKDLTTTQTLAIGTLTMTIRNIGYVTNAFERWPKQIIRIHLKDGTILTRTIQNSSIVSNMEEQLTVDTPWAANYTTDDIERIEFLEKVRIDVDDIVIVHYNGLGQAECIVPIKEVENS